MEDVLLQFDFSQREAMFPCPSRIEYSEHSVPRRASRNIADVLISGRQYVCLTGGGGCGKTTALRQIENLLPEGSVMVVFDCYGKGSYLDSGSLRYRPREAFLQLSNELAVRMRVPLLLTRSQAVDYPREFKLRVEKASEALRSITPGALLIIAVDAADNAVTASRRGPTPDPCFVHELVTLGVLPNNVRVQASSSYGRTAGADRG